MLKINRYTVDYIEDDIVKATATIFWHKLPTFIGNGKALKQIYLTDIESFEKGYGFKLMTQIIDHYKSELTKKTKPGHSRDLIWLKVDKDNARAITLYKRVGFIEMHHVDNWIWMSMCLIVRQKHADENGDFKTTTNLPEGNMSLEYTGQVLLWIYTSHYLDYTDKLQRIKNMEVLEISLLARIFPGCNYISTWSDRLEKDIKLLT